jgi:hypothetical protein
MANYKPTNAELTQEVLSNFIQYYGTLCRYCKQSRAWFFWHDAQWSQDRTLLVFYLVRLACRAKGKQVDSATLKVRLGSYRMVEAVERLCRKALTVPVVGPNIRPGDVQ